MHIGQGWPLANTAQPLRSGEPSARLAARSAPSSACAVGSPVASISLTPLAITAPSLTTTAPKGLPPWSALARARAIASAGKYPLLSIVRPFHLFCGRTPAAHNGIAKWREGVCQYV